MNKTMFAKIVIHKYRVINLTISKSIESWIFNRAVRLNIYSLMKENASQ